MKTHEDQIDLSELKEYQVENPSVQLRRLATQVVSQRGKVWTLLLTREIAMIHGLDGE